MGMRTCLTLEFDTALNHLTVYTCTYLVSEPVRTALDHLTVRTWFQKHEAFVRVLGRLT